MQADSTGQHRTRHLITGRPGAEQLRPGQPGSRQEGVALLAAIILMLALVTTMGSIFYRHQLQLGALAGNLHEQQARLLALSAENWAVSLLASDRDDPAVDHLEEDWARPLPPMPIANGQVSGCLRDLQGRLNLNSFAAWDADSWENALQPDSHTLADVLQNLLVAQELSPREEQIASLIDWVDQDNQPINQWGAEQGYYDTLRPRYMVPNGPLQSVAELAVIRGFDAALVSALRPWLTALPAVTTINVNTASPGLLLAMAGEQGEAFVESVLRGRPFESLGALHTHLAATLGLVEEAVTRQWPATWLGVNSHYFALEMRVVLGEATIDMTSIVERREGQRPEVLRRELSRLPAIDRQALNEEQRQVLRHSCDSVQSWGGELS